MTASGTAERDQATEDPSVAICAKYARAIVVLFLALVVLRVFVIENVADDIRNKTITDFHAFYVVSQLIQRGVAETAYSFDALFREPAFFNAESFMPYTYPPPFGVLIAPFALVSAKTAYGLFALSTLVFFLVVLFRVAGRGAGLVMVALMPAMLSTLACGQNGFLTAGLLGLGALGLIGDRRWAGVPLGLMVIKPHLAVTLGFATLVTGRWRAVATAAATGLAFCGLATLVLGVSIWPAFLEGVREAKEFLLLGYYPLIRMVSTYAFMKTAGAPSWLALAAQTGVSLAVLAAIVLMVRMGLAFRLVLGLATMASVTVSPYAYDYDMPVYAMGLAMVLPDLLARSTRGEQIAIFALGFFASMYGYALTLLWAQLFGDVPTPNRSPISPAALAILTSLGLTWRILLRAERPAETTAPAPTPAAA